MTDDQILFRDLNFSGSFHPGQFRLPRFRPWDGFADRNIAARKTFKLFSPRGAASDLSTKGRSSFDAASSTVQDRSTESHRAQLSRHMIFRGDTNKQLSPLGSADFKRLQTQKVDSRSSLAEKLHGKTRRKSSADSKKSAKMAAEKTKKMGREQRKCLELLATRKKLLVILGAVVLLVALLAVALGVGIHFGVIAKDNKAPLISPNDITTIEATITTLPATITTLPATITASTNSSSNTSQHTSGSQNYPTPSSSPPSTLVPPSTSPSTLTSTPTSNDRSITNPTTSIPSKASQFFDSTSGSSQTPLK